MFANILVVVAFMRDGKYFDYPFCSRPMLATLNPINADVSTLIDIHHTIPSNALNPYMPAVTPMKIFEHTLDLLIKS